jgi:hypothetical protein
MAGLGFITRAVVVAVLAAGAMTVAAITPTRASVISDTPTLPLLGVPYVTSNSDACFPLAGVCVTDGTFTLTSLISSTFDATGQHITTNALYSGILTDLSDVPIGPVELFGTVEQEVLGRTFPTQTGSWTTELVSLSLSGLVLGHTLTLALDPANDSTGTTSITPIGINGGRPFRIDSFFDVFVELTLDTPIPLTTKREITAVAVQAVPEASSLAAISIALPMMLAMYRRRGVASPATRTT